MMNIYNYHQGYGYYKPPMTAQVVVMVKGGPLPFYPPEDIRIVLECCKDAFTHVQNWINEFERSLMERVRTAVRARYGWLEGHPSFQVIVDVVYRVAFSFWEFGKVVGNSELFCTEDSALQKLVQYKGDYLAACKDYHDFVDNFIENRTGVVDKAIDTALDEARALVPGELASPNDLLKIARSSLLAIALTMVTAIISSLIAAYEAALQPALWQFYYQHLDDFRSQLESEIDKVMATAPAFTNYEEVENWVSLQESDIYSRVYQVASNFIGMAYASIPKA